MQLREHRSWRDERVGVHRKKRKEDRRSLKKSHRPWNLYCAKNKGAQRLAANGNIAIRGPEHYEFSQLARSEVQEHCL